MSPLEYFRPKTVAEALELLHKGIPLAGGTAITPRRSEVSAVVDLQDLDLDGLGLEGQTLVAGSGLKLQKLVEAGAPIPPALAAACRLEAAWNLRNMATLGGVSMAADGRSPLLTTLLACGAQIEIEPGGERIPLDDLLRTRGEEDGRRLITKVVIPIPNRLSYDQVARSPVDRPIVCAAVAERTQEAGEGRLSVCLGGFGERPIRVEADKSWVGGDEGVEAATEAARRAYSSAGDQWASAEYRSEVAAILVGRLVREVVAQ